MTKFHAIAVSMLGMTEMTAHHTSHRSVAAAARSLSKGITLKQKHSRFFGIVTPERKVLSLRMAQDKGGSIDPLVERAILAALDRAE